MAVLTKDVPPFCIVRSAALNMVYGTNVVGMRRAGFTPEDRRLVKAAFVTLYLSGLNVSQAVERLREQFPEGVGREMADFVAGSHRGICPCHAAGTGDTPAADE
jgi:UDP-N-acetylglucosamine acyltransferase